MSRMVVLLLAAVAAVTAEELIASVRLLAHDIEVRNVNGDVMIRQPLANGPVTLTGKIFGLNPNSLHGFHVHEKGDMSEGCLSTGGHFNPDNMTHGAPEDTVRHVGDLGNVMSNSEGVAMIDITDTMISLSGPNNILGRAIVVHSGQDDLGKGNSTLSLTTGNAGDRWACGIIGVIKI